MVRVMKPPEPTSVAGVNAMMGDMLAPATPPEVMEVKVIPVMAAVFKATDCPASVLVLIWKPPVTIARAPPRVSPFRVMVRAPVPVARPPVVRTIVVLVAVAAGVEVAVNASAAFVMEVTVPKK